MSHTTMRENIKAEVDHLDPAALQSIWEIIDRAKIQPAVALEPVIGSAPNRAAKAAGQFVGENLTSAEYESLPLAKRGLLALRLKEKNHSWLQEKFAALNAAWLVVVDGEVIASGKSLKDEPMPPQILEICRRTGKFPFVFIDDAFLAIEESASTWHETNEPNDYYPTLSMTLSSPQNTVEMVGDFDTGAIPTFADYDFLVDQKLILSERGDALKASRHLDQPYVCVSKWVRFKLSSHVAEAKIYCVLDWRQSPFVAINPNRTALIGRDILLELKPQVRLDFEKRQTEIVTAKMPARKKTASKKKSVTPKRHRA
jgi:hypothetical protein